MITLTRPIVFFDLETTGLDVFSDRIVQLAAIKIFPDGKKETHEWLINPKIPIPKVTSEIHGITDEMVKFKPAIGDIAQELSKVFSNCDLGGYNIKNFDIPVLREEFNSIGLILDTEEIKIVDSMKIFQIKEPRTLSAAYQKYCNKEMVNAHDAMVDITASIEVLEGQIKFYDDIPTTPEAFHDYCFPADPEAYDSEGKLRYSDGQLIINFGKNKGKTLQSLAAGDPGYLEWILRGSFSDKVKDAVRGALGN